MHQVARQHAESLLAGQAAVLESVATGAPLSEVLARIARLIEAQDSGLMCSIVVLDDKGRLEIGAGGNVPADHLQGAIGRAVEPPYGGPCSMAIHLRQTVVTPDVRTDTRWSERWLESARRHGLRSACSTPILAADGGVLGSFSMYRREPGDAAPDEQLASAATHLAGIAIQRARDERTLRDSRSRLAWELDAMQRLHALVLRLFDCSDLRAALDEVLDATIGIAGADMGNVQLYDRERQALEIVAQRGFEPMFLEHFRAVGIGTGTACARALAGGKQVVIEDVQVDPGHAPHRDVAIAAGWHGVQSTPLLGREREVLGMLSTHYRRPHRPSGRELRMLDLYARQAAQFIERKRDEERVAALNERIARRAEEQQIMLDLLPVGIFIAHGADCTSISTNPAGAAILGLTPDADASKTGPEAARLPFRVLRDGVEVAGEDLPMQRAARTGQPVSGEELQLERGDGALLTLYEYASPLFDPAGRVRGCVGAFVDITARRKAEEALRESDRRKDEFISILAHELRNPLAPLRNGLQVMRLAGSNAEIIEQAGAMMERQLGHMVRLVDDLLDLGRISRGRIEMRKERVELARVVHAAVETSRPLIELRAHRLALDLPEAPLYVEADVTRLAQVFSNLLHNAAKFTERGGRIRLAARQDDNEVLVSVADSGIGIPPQMLPGVFEMFTQIERSLERSQGGLGIGLTLVKRLVALHGGSVEARSGGEGMGSEFIVRLPLVLSIAPAQPRAAETPAVHAPARRRVLVVDDSRDAALSLALMLGLMGNDTRTAHDGFEALEVAAAYRPDAILLDIGMPQLNGYETARRIREQPWGEPMLLVALTGWGQEGDKRRSSEAGFDRHLTKPVEPAALEALLGGIGMQAEREVGAA